MSNPAISNTSPLIFLAKAGHLDLLRLAGQPVVIPQPVLDEIASYTPADIVMDRIRAQAWLQVIPAIPIPGVIQAWDLGPGESSVLAHGCVTPASTLILDDLAARRCAAALHIPVCGTVGLVLRAKRSGVIPAVRPVIESLFLHGMYLSRSIIESVLASVGESK